MKGARGAQPTPHPRAVCNGYLLMYLSSTIFESGRKIGGKTSSLHFGLKKVSMFEVLTSCVFSIALRKSMKRETDLPLRILSAVSMHRMTIAFGYCPAENLMLPSLT